MMGGRGPIAVSADDGTIAVYAAGRRKEDGLTDGVDPPLRRASNIATSRDGDTIYLSDPDDGRIIAVTSRGELVGQVQSDAFRGLTDIALDATESSLYVLRGDAISVIVPPKPTN